MKTLDILLPYPPYIDTIIDEAKKEFGLTDVKVIFAKTKAERMETLKSADAVISGPLSPEELNTAKNLKMVQVPYAGVDEFDLNDIMTERSIILANVHGNALSVAEHAFALLLALAKGIVRNDKDLRNGYWHGWMSREPNMELEGKTVCIIGLGSIGKNIARIAKAFGMKVIGVKKTAEQVENTDKVFTTESMSDAIKDADFIVIAVPTTNETRGFINKSVLEQMRGKFLINVGRGDVINEQDLFVSLKNRVLKGAAIDTWWVYPKKPYEFAYPAHYPFWLLDNIILSCHTAGYSDGSIRKNWTEAVRNVMRFFAGKPVLNIISIEKGY
jgi:phosphoglycerate dehydrogenase-like enzyme